MVPKWLGLSTSVYTRVYEVLVLGAVPSVTYAVDLTSVDVQIKNSGNPFPDASLKVNSIWTGVIVKKDIKESSCFCALPHINRLCVLISFSKSRHRGGKT